MLILLFAGGATVTGAPPATRTLVPIGGDYLEATLQRFAQAAAQRDTSGNVALLVLPITYATDPFSITPDERTENLALADERRAQIETACVAIKRPEQICQAILAPILVRDDASLPGNLELFTADVDGIYILGGDQTIAMQVVANTPTERRMEAAYNRGVVIGGNSAGAAVESLTMIAGYTGDNGPENGLQQGSVDLWRSDGRSDRTRGLIFGLANAILEQHTYQRGRIGRLLSVVGQTMLPAVGVDFQTGVAIENETWLTDVVGPSSAIVLDPKTFMATARYAGPTRSLAIHRLATHLIPPGGYGFDLKRLQPLVNGDAKKAPKIQDREFDMLQLRDVGTLLLGGDISGDKSGAVAQRFVQRSGGTTARLVVLVVGYADSVAAQADAQSYATAFQAGVAAPVRAFVLDAHADQRAIRRAVERATGIFLTAPDQSLVLPALDQVTQVVHAIRRAWRGGTTLMADNAAAAALGESLSVDPAPTDDTLEDDAIADFRADGVEVRDGLGFVHNIAIEPRLLPDRHWGRLYNLLRHDHSSVAFGIDIGTALEVTPNGAIVRGTSAVVSLDGRYADFGVGSNGAISATYVLLDSFVAGDKVRP
jgi:cyanophycinase